VAGCANPRFSPKAFALTSTACHRCSRKRLRTYDPSWDHWTIRQLISQCQISIFICAAGSTACPQKHARFSATRGTELLRLTRPARFSATWTYSSVKSMPVTRQPHSEAK
jgi:hypothetical protein